MEFLSSENKRIALDILEDILSAIERVEERTQDSRDWYLSYNDGRGMM